DRITSPASWPGLSRPWPREMFEMKGICSEVAESPGRIVSRWLMRPGAESPWNSFQTVDASGAESLCNSFQMVNAPGDESPFGRPSVACEHIDVAPSGEGASDCASIPGWPRKTPAWIAAICCQFTALIENRLVGAPANRV